MRSNKKISVGIMIGTYKRFIPYIKTLMSVRGALTSTDKFTISAHIGVDTKLGYFRYLIKKLITNLILIGKNFTYSYAGGCIGETRNYLICNNPVTYFMNLDDDDLLNSSELVAEVNDLVYTNGLPDIVNFDFYPNYKFKRKLKSIYYRGEWLPIDWNTLEGDLNVGQSSLFRSKLYQTILDISTHYKFEVVDDALPNQCMYYMAESIVHTNRGLVTRNGGKDRLTKEPNINKLYYLLLTRDGFRRFILKYPSSNGTKFESIVNRNNFTYYAQKLGDKFRYILSSLKDE